MTCKIGGPHLHIYIRDKDPDEGHLGIALPLNGKAEPSRTLRPIVEAKHFMVGEATIDRSKLYALAKVRCDWNPHGATYEATLTAPEHESTSRKVRAMDAALPDYNAIATSIYNNGR